MLLEVMCIIFMLLDMQMRSSLQPQEWGFILVSWLSDVYECAVPAPVPVEVPVPAPRVYLPAPVPAPVPGDTL